MQRRRTRLLKCLRQKVCVVDEEIFPDGRNVRPVRFYNAVAVTLCIAMVTVAGCRRATHMEAAVVVHQRITPLPIRAGTSVIAIQLADAEAKPISHAAIHVEADMTHPGMAPLFSDAKETAPGSYEAPVDFNMGGDWVVLLHIQLADGQKAERRVDVAGVRSN